MEILKLDEIIIAFFNKGRILRLIRLLLYHTCEVAWAHTQEIILNIKPGEIRLSSWNSSHYERLQKSLMFLF